MESFSDRLLTQHQALWQAMQQHRFVVDIEHDRLPASVFNRYLVFEGNFVATAIAIFALAVSKAPGIRQQRWLIGVLNALVDTQIAWFEAVLARRGIQPADYPDDPARRQRIPRWHAESRAAGQLCGNHHPDVRCRVDVLPLVPARQRAIAAGR